MKKIIQISILQLLGFMAHGQVGIGTTTPHASAVLELEHPNGALLITRVANTAAISNPVNGMLIYDLSSNCFKGYMNGAWSGCFSMDPVGPLVSNLDCTGIVHTGYIIVNNAASITTSTVSYSGGNGLAYSGLTINSTGVTGLTATLASGTLANGAGSLVFNISGTPSAAGVATFSLSFGGKSCSFSRTVYSCGALTAVGTYKEFMCHNLGADTSLDPNVPVQAIGGNYYQWGIATPIATSYTPATNIVGLNLTPAPNGSWSDVTKTANDPCPSGYRLPTKTEYDAIIANNVASFTGTWTSSATNFGSAVHFGPVTGLKSITFPANGYRDNGANNTGLFNRGLYGLYWTSTEYSSYAWYAYLGTYSGNGDLGTDTNYRILGASVRCIKQ